MAIIGFPKESKGQILETINYIIELRRRGWVDHFDLFPATPYPGTELYEEVKEEHVKGIGESKIIEDGMVIGEKELMKQMRRHSFIPEKSINDEFDSKELRQIILDSYKLFEDGEYMSSDYLDAIISRRST